MGVNDVVLCAGDEDGGRGGFDGVDDCVGMGRDATVAYEGRVGETGWGGGGGGWGVWRRDLRCNLRRGSSSVFCGVLFLRRLWQV